MSIATRLEAINQHLLDDYSVLTLAGADLTNVNKNILNLKTTWQERLLYFINNGTDVVWNNWEKVTGEGTALTLNNTEEAPMSLVYKGNTYQETTTGKNLFYSEIESGGISSTEGTDDNRADLSNIRIRTKDYISVSDAQMTLSWLPSTLQCYGYCYDSSKTFLGITTGWNNTPFTFTPRTNTAYIRFVWRKSDNSNISPTDINTIQLELGASQTSYEEYTGGIASPNPDYPQPIHVVSGDNSIVVCGENLFDESYYNNYNLYTKNGNFYSYIEMPNSFKTKFYGNLTLKGASQNLLFGFSTTNNSVPNVQRMLNAGNINSNVEYDFTNATNVYLIIGNGNGITLATDIPKIFENYNIMVSTTSNKPYKPYQSQSYPINLGDIELCKIGDYQDYIFKNTPNTTDYNSDLEDNVWYLKKEIGKTIINSSTGWGLHNSSTGTKYRFITTANNFLSLFPNIILEGESQITGKLLCNMEQQALFSNTAYGKFSINASSSVNNCWCLMNFDDSSVTTVNEFNTFISSNNAVFYYPLATPTYTEITDSTLISQLNALAKSYNSQTNISQNNTDLPFIINVTALEEIE